jgi:hypothetical protein
VRTLRFVAQMLTAPPSGDQPDDEPIMSRAREAGLGELCDMRLAVVWGLEPAAAAAGPVHGYRQATTSQRLARLRGAAAIQRERWLADEERSRLERLLESARARVLDQGVAKRLDAQPDAQTFVAPEVEQEQMLESIAQAIHALELTDGFQRLRNEATTVTRFTPESVRALKWLAGKAPKGSAMESDLKFPLAGGVYFLKGLLNGLDVALRVADPVKRQQLVNALAVKSGFKATDVASLATVFVQVYECSVAVVGWWTYRKLLRKGFEAEALDWFRWVTARAPILQAEVDAGKSTAGQMLRNNFLIKGRDLLPLRTISWLSSGVQIASGILILLDSESTDSEKLAAELGVALGAAGIAGAAFTGLGKQAFKSVAGWATLYLQLLAWKGELERARLRESQIEAATDDVKAAFGLVQSGVGEIVRAANALDETLTFQREAHSGKVPSRAPRREVVAAAARRSESQARVLRRTLLGLLKPPKGDVPLKDAHAFDAALKHVTSADSPEEVLASAAQFLGVVRDQFRHPARTVARTLRAWDRQYDERSLFDDFFGVEAGLHDNLKGVAAGTSGPGGTAAGAITEQWGKD